ncbi:MAG TPA: hypothetical protein VF188_15640 [Longimicrobiales bacterium]
MKKLLLAVGVTCLVAINAPAAQAQVSFGAQASFADDTDFGVGARANIGLPFSGFKAIASFDYFFPDGFDYFELNGNAVYSIRTTTPGFGPYVGGGLNIAHSSVDAIDFSDTEMGLNLLGGAEFGTGPIKPFAELRIELRDEGQFVLAGGVNF